ncbi:MAG: hypothetical protein PHS96_11510 [Anaerolineales bacterium]|nr:hypothetical protein [Anaerolineales bacterium]
MNMRPSEVTMINRRIATLMCLAGWLLAACNPVASTPVAEQPGSGGGTGGAETPISSVESPGGVDGAPWEPRAGDGALLRGEVFVDASEVLLLESYPVQAMLWLEGSLPTPCHSLRAAVQPPDTQGRIMVEIYSLVPPDKMCAQVLQPFEESIRLGSFSSGTFSVWMNGEKVGEFQI